MTPSQSTSSSAASPDHDSVSSGQPPSRLRISVIVPVFNDAQGLVTTVNSLAGQRFPRSEYEVVVVDNGSSDETFEVARQLASTYADLVHVEQERVRRGSYAARNVGVERSSGELLCFIDADMTVPPEYLERIHSAFQDGADYLGCGVDIYYSNKTWAGEYDRVYGFPVVDYMVRQHFAPTCCMSVRRNVLESLGGFDSRLESSGDFEFGQRVHHAGYRQVYLDSVALRHPARTTFPALFTKSRRVARGMAQLTYYHGAKYDWLTGQFRRARFYAPRRPQLVRRRYRDAGNPISTLEAIAVSVWMLPLRWVRPVVYFLELQRLKRTSGRRSSAPAPRGLAAGGNPAGGGNDR